MARVLLSQQRLSSCVALVSRFASITRCKHYAPPSRTAGKVAAAANTEVYEENMLDMYSVPIRRRILKLKDLQEDQKKIDGEYMKAKAELDKQFEAKYAPLYQQRQQVVAGEAAVPSYDIADDPNDKDTGIPDFWLTALSNMDIISAEITERDAQVLTYLTDITTETVIDEKESWQGFTLTFSFAANPFFRNQVLTKTYWLASNTNIVPKQFVGTEIQWNPDKDVTVKKIVKKVRSGKGGGTRNVTTIEPTESFFNFFNPVQIPDPMEDVEDEEIDSITAEIDRDFEIGVTIREQIIPQAVEWYTGEAAEYDQGGYEDDEGYDDYEEEELEPEPPKPKGKKKQN